MIKFNDGERLSYNRNPFLKRNWFVTVTNDNDGRNFISQLKKKNPNKRFKLRGRHSDRKHLYNNILKRNYKNSGAEHEVPLEHAERIAVYIYIKNNGSWDTTVENIKI